jgi:Fe-S cluster assembly protein SufD
MTAVEEREVVYVEKDAKPPLIISDNPEDHVAFNKQDEFWKYLPKNIIEKFAQQAPGAGNATLDVKNAKLETSMSTTGVAGLRVRDIVTANSISSNHHKFVITVDSNLKPDEVVSLDLDAAGESNSAFEINIAPQVQTQIVLRDRCQGDTALNLSVNVGKGANVKFVLLTEESAAGIHFGHFSVNVSRDAVLTAGIISLGANVVRRSFDSRFDDVSGEMVLLGATHTTAGQYSEHRTVVDHNIAHCRSFVDFRCAVDGEGSHSVWIGDTIIRYNAIGSDTYETNRNLVLSKGARADSVPNLEIETGEVAGAGHASATGRLDDEQLFYLTSRGLTSEQALKLIVVGFFANIVARMGIPSIVEEVISTIEAKLKQGNK